MTGIFRRGCNREAGRDAVPATDPEPITENRPGKSEYTYTVYEMFTGFHGRRVTDRIIVLRGTDDRVAECHEGWV